MSEDKGPPDQQFESLSRMARETSDFYVGLATALHDLESQAPSIYRFEIEGSKAEALGAVFLPSDSDAIAFGADIARNAREREMTLAGCILNICNGERTVAIIPLT